MDFHLLAVGPKEDIFLFLIASIEQFLCLRLLLSHQLFYTKKVFTSISSHIWNDKHHAGHLTYYVLEIQIFEANIFIFIIAFIFLDK